MCLAGDCASDRIGHRGAAGAERFWRPDSGIPRRLVLDFRVQFGPAQHDDRRHPHPHHQADRGAERAVGGVIVSEIGEIPGQRCRTGEPERCRRQRAETQPFPARRAPARPEPVEHAERDQQDDKHQRPARQADDQLALGLQPEMIERERKRHHRADHYDQRSDAADGECQRQQVQLDEAAFLALLIDHVKRVDDGLHAGIGAPDRERQAEQEARAESRRALGQHPRDLVLHDLERALGQHQCERLQIGADGRGIGEQAVGGDQRSDRRKHREQAEEHHAGGGGEQAVVGGALVGAPQDVFPAGPRYPPRMGRVPAASALQQLGRQGTALGSRFRGRVRQRRRCLKIALRGEHQDRCRSDQEQVVGHLGSRAEHHIAVRRACCRRRATAQPSRSPATARPACTLRSTRRPRGGALCVRGA